MLYERVMHSFCKTFILLRIQIDGGEIMGEV
jgi:hypothetical protein